MAVTINGSAGVTTNIGAVYNGIQATTPQASTSGTSVLFSGVPSWVKRVTVMFDSVSTNGSSPYIIQLGTSGGIQTTGYSGGVFIYNGGSALTAFTTGFLLQQQLTGGSADTFGGTCTITALNAGSGIWTETSILTSGNNGYVNTGAGSKTLSAVLTQLQVTTVNGTDTFDGGSINILYE